MPSLDRHGPSTFSMLLRDNDGRDVFWIQGSDAIETLEFCPIRASKLGLAPLEISRTATEARERSENTSERSFHPDKSFPHSSQPTNIIRESSGTYAGSRIFSYRCSSLAGSIANCTPESNSSWQKRLPQSRYPSCTNSQRV